MIRLLFTGLFVLSISGLLFIGSTIIYNKRLQAHPQMMIAYICFAEALMSYNALLKVINPSLVACYFGLDKIFVASTFQMHPTCDTYYKAVDTLCETNALFFQGF